MSKSFSSWNAMKNWNEDDKEVHEMMRMWKILISVVFSSFFDMEKIHSRQNYWGEMYKNYEKSFNHPLVTELLYAFDMIIFRVLFTFLINNWNRNFSHLNCNSFANKPNIFLSHSKHVIHVHFTQKRNERWDQDWISQFTMISQMFWHEMRENCSKNFCVE